MSADSSSEHWSFENLTQSTDSGHPLIAAADPKHQNPPLSLILRSPHAAASSVPLGRSSPTIRSPSSSSHIPHLHRYQNPRPDSFSSESFSLYHSSHNSNQHLLYPQPSQNSMYAVPEAATPHDPLSPANHPPVWTPRASVYSDRAAPASAQSGHGSAAQLHTLRMYSSASPPLAAPAVAYTRPADDDRRPQSNSIVALSTKRQPNTTASPEIRSSHEQGSDPLAHKEYALPPTDDEAIPRPAAMLQQWQRLRIERDYSHGVARQFSLTVPAQLSSRIDEQRMRRFVRRINAMLAEAEGATLRNIVEGCLAYATLYLSTLIIRPHYAKTIDRISRFVESENKALFQPAGLLIIDPRQTAYMFIEILVVN